MILKMKKKNIYQFLYAISVFLLLGFWIRLGIDYAKYNKFTNSAPFYLFIIERAIEFLLPSVIIFIVARITKKKYNKE